MKFTAWVQSHHRSILFLLSAFAVAGLVSSLSLPVSLFPQVEFPRVVVSLDAGDRPAERMAIEVTWPIEQAVRAVPGVRSVRSTTSRGSADVSVNFDWGQDMVAAMLQVESAVNKVLGALPPGTTFDVHRMDPTMFPVLGYSLTSDTRSLVELRDLALYQMRPVLSTVTGVSHIQVQGGATAEDQVLVDPARLDSFGLSLDDVAHALSDANIITAVGKLEEHNKLYLILSDTQFRDFEQIGQTILRSGANGLVRLQDVATVSRGTTPQWIRVTADGRDAVLVQVYQQPGGTSVTIARDVKARLDANAMQVLQVGNEMEELTAQTEQLPRLQLELGQVESQYQQAMTALRGCPSLCGTSGGPLSLHQAAVLDDVTSLVWRSSARTRSHMSR